MNMGADREYYCYDCFGVYAICCFVLAGLGMCGDVVRRCFSQFADTRLVWERALHSPETVEQLSGISEYLA